MRLAATGLTNAEIGSRLHISHERWKPTSHTSTASSVSALARSLPPRRPPASPEASNRPDEDAVAERVCSGRFDIGGGWG